MNGDTTKIVTITSQEALAELKCRHGCASPPIGIFYMPEGCLCFSDPVQALCMQHAVKADSTGPIMCVVDFRIWANP